MNSASGSPYRERENNRRSTATDFFERPTRPIRDWEASSPSRRPAMLLKPNSDKIDRPRDSYRPRSPSRDRGGRELSGRWDARKRASRAHVSDYRVNRHQSQTPTYRYYRSSSPSARVDRSPSLSNSRQHHTHREKDSYAASNPQSVETKAIEGILDSHKLTAQRSNMSIDQVTASESIASRQGQSSPTTSIVGPNQIKDMLESPVRPKMAEPRPTPSNGASISACSQLLFQIFENATDMASLKTQEMAAQKDFDKKDTDLRKWNAMNGHNKFPTHDEMHKRNKDLAKKALESSKEKCNQKIAEVEDIIHRGSECLVSTIRSGNQPDQDNQQLQLQVETLLRAIQSLDKQVQEHQSHIEKQTTANEALETELRKVKTDLATACSRQAYLETDLAKLPKNFYSKFQSISDRVESLSSKFKIISHQEEATNDASSIAFADYSERLQKLERVVKDQTVSLKTVGTKLPTVDSLLERITALEGQHPNKVLAELQAEVSDSKKVLQDLASRSLATRAEIGDNMAHTKKDLESLNSRLTTLPSNIELAELRKKLAFAESATGKVEKLQSELTSFKKRLELVEQQPRQNRQRSAPAEPLNEHEQFASFEERLVDLKKQVRLEKPAMVSLSNEEFDDLKKRLAKMESESVALHFPRHSMPSPGFDSESFEKSILAKVDAMQAGSDETMGALIDELTSKLNGVSHSVENLTKNELFHAGALQQIEAKYNHLVNDQKEHVGNVEKDLHDRVDAVTHGIKTINARLDNIFTKDMALHILQQMDAAYPHLRAVETTLEQHKSALEQVEARFRAIDVSVAKIPASTQALRDDFDKLQKEAACIGQVAKDARDAIDFFVNQNSKDSDTLADNFADIHGQLSDLKEWKSQQESLAKASAAKPLCALARPPPVSTSRDAPTSNGDGSLEVGSTASRKSSGEPPSKVGKKRGHSGLAPQPTPAKPNGIHNGPSKKRKTDHITFDGGADPEEVTFEPDLPTIDLDDD